ncbi:MAG TPA: cytochrome c [Rhabdaerophilum sp.]|nr:cytochrome c [Rhabdaerophilum sp.]
MRVLASSILILASSFSGAEAANAKRGLALAKERCAACHAVTGHGASPDIKAPTFRRIAGQWPVEQLQEALAEGIVTGHPGMPEFTFTPREIDDFLAHLRRLRDR